ncbi:iron-containing alcohol dehydrogenase [Thermogladius sp. 4427co]|uniref:iron-containing alcohol dehydrogenase n=1 Tax=Thermogladius sp. 4427co TaxID=3450718 RepID=UPI003F792F85
MKPFRLKHEDVILYFGEGSLEKASWFFNGLKKVGVITGKQSARVSGALDDLTKIMSEKGIEPVFYNEVSPNPFLSQALKASEQFWRESVDAIIAIGGGSVIDVAKVVSVLTVSGCKFESLLQGVKPKRRLPLLAINLTHGTGTEVDRYAVVTVDETREKHGLSVTYPDVSIDDPRYTLTLSLEQTIYTSLDAFYHAYESATSTVSFPLVETLSFEAITIIGEKLPKLVGNLRDVNLRASMLYASMLAGLSIDMASTHLVHGIEHVLSGLEPRLPHGAGLAMLGPRVVYYTHKAMPEVSARLLKPLNPYIKPIAEDAERAMKSVQVFQERVGFKQRLGDYGFTENDIPRITEFLFTRLKYMIEETPFQVTEDIVRDVLKSAF